MTVTEKDPRLVAFGARVKAARVAAGLTQAQVAGAAKLNRVTVAKIEAGKVDVLYTTIVRLAEAIGVGAELLTSDGD